MCGGVCVCVCVYEGWGEAGGPAKIIYLDFGLLCFFGYGFKIKPYVCFFGTEIRAPRARGPRRPAHGPVLRIY